MLKSNRIGKPPQAYVLAAVFFYLEKRDVFGVQKKVSDPAAEGFASFAFFIL